MLGEAERTVEMKRLLVVFAVTGLLCSLAWALGLKPDNENVVASRLEGSWRPERSLNIRLLGSAGAKDVSKLTIAFKADESVVSVIPEKYGDFNNCPFMAYERVH